MCWLQGHLLDSGFKQLNACADVRDHGSAQSRCLSVRNAVRTALPQADEPPTYRRKTHARCVNLIAPESGGAFSHDAVRALLAPLASFESIRLRLADGALLRRTVDLNSSPGALFLVHDDPEQIERDYQTIRTWENRSRPQHS
ncbi:hypothetical protein [Burkholderia territorii]|uniref:hypothetical protein n=1 Tax=Burkholderia territorii TaxID=1503055 RepID=UPI0018C88395|nr:hypothetical protein [Burkholderia territorii]